MSSDTYRIGSFEFTSRLFVGTGKYSTFDQMVAALDWRFRPCPRHSIC